MIKKLALIEIRELTACKIKLESLDKEFRLNCGLYLEDNNSFEDYFLNIDSEIDNSLRKVRTRLKELLLDFDKQFGLEKTGFEIPPDGGFIFPTRILVGNTSKEEISKGIQPIKEEFERQIRTYTSESMTRSEKDVHKLIGVLTSEKINHIINEGV